MTVAIAAAGTGGHVFPALAVARALDPEARGESVSELVRPLDGETLWLLDREAAGELSGPVVV